MALTAQGPAGAFMIPESDMELHCRSSTEEFSNPDDKFLSYGASHADRANPSSATCMSNA